jgi:predicted ATPase/DNA-binding SARP family transcriptional activator
MKNRLDIHTLGDLSFGFQNAQEPLALSGKGRALLVYLACTGRSCRREFAAELLWPGRTQSQSLSNLRKLLVELRQAVGDYVDSDRAMVGFAPGAAYWLDVDEIERLLSQANHHELASANAIATLEAALALYQGDFLDGFALESDEFDAWVTVERERLRFAITGVLDHLVDAYTQRGDAGAGMACISRLLHLDPLREKTYRQAMRLLASTGQREAALRQYEACQRTLRDELGIVPGAHTSELAERIRRAEFSPVEHAPPLAAANPSRHRLPAQPTSFVGRQEEVAALLDRLADPACRLLTIGGPGGIGKTRLALEVAQRAGAQFVDGAAFAPLAPVASPDEIAPAIFGALNLPPPENVQDLRSALLADLQPRSVLLVLDNLEHLLSDLSLIEAILDRAPSVRLLVTSRQPLGLDWEWYFPLGGLSVPAPGEADCPECFTSVQLFVERARRVRPGFSLVDDPAGVVAICQRVEGMPLGIELAAAWVRVLSCGEIADHILTLETPYHARDGRHVSLRALFETTWQRLSAREQTILQRLAVFHGSFSADAAEAVSGAQHADLALLVQKSLIGLNFHARRYEFHQLLRGFLHEKLTGQPDLCAAAEAAHSNYYMRFLQTCEEGLRGSNPLQALDVIRADLDNMRVAWRYAVEHRRFDWIERCSAAVTLYLTINGMHAEALTVFQHALGVLLTERETPDRDRVELVLQSALLAPMGCVFGWEDDHLWPVAERICALARRIGDDERLMMGLTALVNLYINEEWERAVETAREAAEFSKTLGRREHTLGLMNSEAPLLFTGRLAQALEHARAGQALWDPEDDAWFTMVVGLDPMVSSLTHSGCILTYLGYAEQGESDLQRAEARALAIGQPMALGFVLAFSTMAYVCTRETHKSLVTGQRLRDLAERHQFGTWQAQWPVYSTIGLVQRGDYVEGSAALASAIEVERQAGLTHNMTAWLAHLGYALVRIGRLESGLAEIHRAMALVERTGERFHESVVLRLQGEAFGLLGDERGAEASFEHAVRIAHMQQSRFYELQAMIALYDLYASQGRAPRLAYRLQSLTDWFTEGLDRPDLIAARNRLSSLAVR